MGHMHKAPTMSNTPGHRLTYFDIINGLRMRCGLGGTPHISELNSAIAFLSEMIPGDT